MLLHCSYFNYGTDFNEILDMIFSNKASVNFYMFHGGTNWGFMNGANVMDTTPFYAPDVASYGKYPRHFVKGSETVEFNFLLYKFNTTVYYLTQ